MEFLEQVNVVRMAIEGSTEFGRTEEKDNIDQKPLKPQPEHLEPSQSMDRLGKTINLI